MYIHFYGRCVAVSVSSSARWTCAGGCQRRRAATIAQYACACRKFRDVCQRVLDLHFFVCWVTNMGFGRCHHISITRNISL
ncbi:hypothetical protein DPMN_053600 [Dreissena polymorpha]|uniref:Uncharacterized protein n=1 Tax=Dreissena polymorpha TaxID=45954 RepID=A0A9D4HQV3_DREPO|nr:hypothetical protein DPMN_053600 [Dreissena polymorpha]